MDTSLLSKLSQGEIDLGRGFYFGGFFVMTFTSLLNLGLKRNILNKNYFIFFSLGASYLIAEKANDFFRYHKYAAFEKIDNDNVGSASFYRTVAQEKENKH